MFTGRWPHDLSVGWRTPLDAASPTVALWETPNLNSSIPLYRSGNGDKIRILALQITIRIWDSNTKQTRQTSIVVDM